MHPKMQNLARFAALIAASVAISACSTPYQDMGLLGGVTATQIDATTMRITARGNAFTDKSQIENYVLLKAAEETIGHGYSLFQIANDEDASRNETVSIPETHYANAYGVTATGQPTFATTQYTTEHVSSYFKPGEITLVKMFNGTKPANAPPNIFSAIEVEMYLGPQIKGSQSTQVAAMPVLPAAVVPQSGVPPVSMLTGAENYEDQVPQPACSKDDQELARLARENGYQRSAGCN